MFDPSRPAAPASCGGIVYLHKARILAPSAISLPDICPLSDWINSWLSWTVHQHRCTTKTSMSSWIYPAQQTVISLASASYSCLFRGRWGLYIYDVLNYIYEAIWDTRVGSTDDASGKCLVAVKKEEVVHVMKSQHRNRESCLFY